MFLQMKTLIGTIPIDIYLFKINNKYIKTMSEIFSKLTIETIEQNVKSFQS